jgi:hypothetical protein
MNANETRIGMVERNKFAPSEQKRIDVAKGKLLKLMQESSNNDMSVGEMGVALGLALEDFINMLSNQEQKKVINFFARLIEQRYTMSQNRASANN